MGNLSSIKPERVFYYFEQLCSVPHGSGNTKIISDMCVGFAKEMGLKYRQEDCNNVIIWKDGSKGYENAPAVILQGHMDMVCVKTDDCDKDMSVEGLDVETDGKWVWAKNTSLGGDDCIAVAIILALLEDDSLEHPPLEAVFTIDEETGMDGAIALDCSDLKGKMMINLDSEEDGVFTVSCAGGIRLDCFLEGKKESVNGCQGYIVTIEGLLGGHSGAEIHKGRASANHQMGRVLFDAMKKFDGLRIADIRGGKFDNVICPKNDAKIVVPEKYANEFEEFIKQYDAILKNEFSGCDDGISLHAEKTEISEALSEERTSVILNTLLVIPQGVQAMNVDFPGLVQTSLNLGFMGIEDDGIHFTILIRSCIASQKQMIVTRVRAIVEFAGGQVSERAAYPGWQFNRESVLLKHICSVYSELTGKEGKVDATHGGLECGLLIDKMPGLDVVSIGPELHDIHSFSERLSVESTEKLYKLVREVLKRIK